MATDDLLDLHDRLAQQQEWLEQCWRATGGDPQVVVQLLRLWAEGSAVEAELKRRLTSLEDHDGGQSPPSVCRRS
jgi:hypothetical protein